MFREDLLVHTLSYAWIVKSWVDKNNIYWTIFYYDYFNVKWTYKIQCTIRSWLMTLYKFAILLVSAKAGRTFLFCRLIPSALSRFCRRCSSFYFRTLLAYMCAVSVERKAEHYNAKHLKHFSHVLILINSTDNCTIVYCVWAKCCYWDLSSSLVLIVWENSKTCHYHITSNKFGQVCAWRIWELSVLCVLLRLLELLKKQCFWKRKRKNQHWLQVEKLKLVEILIITHLCPQPPGPPQPGPPQPGPKPLLNSGSSFWNFSLHVPM